MGISQIVRKTFKGVLLLPLVVVGLALLWFLFTVLNKAYWDAWVARMCSSKDLVTVFETVDLTDPVYSSLPLGRSGRPIIPFESTRKAGDPFYIRSTSNIESRIGGVNTGIYNTEIVRATDERVMSIGHWFSRTGGDYSSLGGPGSNYSCSDEGHFLTEQFSSTFVSSEG